MTATQHNSSSSRSLEKQRIMSFIVLRKRELRLAWSAVSFVGWRRGEGAASAIFAGKTALARCNQMQLLSKEQSIILDGSLSRSTFSQRRVSGTLSFAEQVLTTYKITIDRFYTSPSEEGMCIMRNLYPFSAEEQYRIATPFPSISELSHDFCPRGHRLAI